MGRHEDLEMPDQTPLDVRFWIDGTIFVRGSDETFRKRVNALRVEAAALGLTPMDQPSTGDRSEKRRRRWSFKRVDVDYAHAVLTEYKNGIAYHAYRDQLYREEPWTDAKKDASMKKTYVMVSHLLRAGRLRKEYDPNTGNTILFSIGSPFSNYQRAIRWGDLSFEEEPDWVHQDRFDELYDKLYEG